jgi:hypothetical protein
MKTLGDDLVDALDNLRVKLNETQDLLNKSGVERTRGLRDIMGKECSHYRKSLDMFIRDDYMELKSMVESLVVKFDLVEGKK